MPRDRKSPKSETEFSRGRRPTPRRGRDQDDGPPFGRDTYQTAIENQKPEILQQAFAQDVRIFVPLGSEPLKGVQAAMQFFGKMGMTFQNITFLHKCTSKDATMVVFQATVPAAGGLDQINIQVCDLLEFDEKNRIKTMTILARPAQALQALAAHGLPFSPNPFR